MKRSNKKVYIGMSGGVDSSVSAALLKKAGYKVIGVFIKIEIAGNCSWRQERREARRAAAHLDIPLITLDLSKEYGRKVVDYLIAEYKAGRTPNPDVMCNKHIKFGVFYDWAMKHSADFVATGHYSQISSFFSLEVSRDTNKDQTYFLWNLKTEQLSKILFPIGHLTKSQVRQLAKKFNLPNSEKKDSQGLCFVGQIDFKDFLKRELAEKPGSVLNERGEIIGKHNGSIFFTLGERHGFEIFSQTPDPKPYYIVAKDTQKNTLTVSQIPHSTNTEKLEVKIEKANWISGTSKLPAKSYPLRARIRYRQPLQSCHLSIIDSHSSIVTFDKPQLATPGQSLVLYDKNICLGGGIIA